MVRRKIGWLARLRGRQSERIIWALEPNYSWTLRVITMAINCGHRLPSLIFMLSIPKAPQRVCPQNFVAARNKARSSCGKKKLLRHYSVSRGSLIFARYSHTTAAPFSGFGTETDYNGTPTRNMKNVRLKEWNTKSSDTL